MHSSDLLIFPSKPLHCFAHEPSLLKHHRYSTTSAASAHSSDLLIFHSPSLHCFAPEPSFLKHNWYSTSPAATVHRSELLFCPSKQLHCFAPEPSLLKHNEYSTYSAVPVHSSSNAMHCFDPSILMDCSEFWLTHLTFGDTSLLRTLLCTNPPAP